MARDTERVHLTLPRIDKIPSPSGKQAVYVFDDDPKHLCVRVTPAGAKSFVYSGKLNGTPLRITIGSVGTWNLDEARAEARRLQTLIDQSIDPRQQRAERLAEVDAKRSAAEAAKIDAERKAAPAIDAWSAYVKARWEKWGELSRRDHKRVAQKGGDLITRGRKTTKDGKTQSGALRSLLSLPLVQIDAVRVQDWLKAEAAKRPTHATMAFRLLRGFANWCAANPEYADQIDAKACAAKSVREELPKRAAKNDCLQREMLRPWFEQVIAIPNPVISAYLQITLLTGRRREQVARLKWDDVDFRWQTIRMQDKTEGETVIPLTPHVAGLLRDLKLRNETPPPEYRILAGKKLRNDLENWRPSEWVFVSKTAESGYLQEPSKQHKSACKAAGIDGLTIHGLRRSFGTLSEWVECPDGISAQIQGHAPSATREKHYIRRPIDLLRKWHTKIESWILAEAELKPRLTPEVGVLVQVAA